MSIDPQRTALVLIEFQNDFTTEGGTLHGAVKDVMANPKMEGDHTGGHVVRCGFVVRRPG